MAHIENTDEHSEKTVPEKVHVGKITKLRGSKNFRLAVIVVLMIIVAGLFIFWGKAKIVLAGIFLILLVALGLETSGNDWDLGKLMKTGSLEQSKVEQKGGRWLIDDKCQKEKLNCDNFEYQEDAQALFEYCGGKENDIHHLDGDKDGIVCEGLKSKSSNKIVPK